MNTVPQHDPVAAPRRRVVVVGSVNVDLLVRLHRHPAPGETVAGEDLRQGAGGKGLNQAVAAARAGAEVVMVGAVGNDPGGHAAVGSLRAEGVDVAGVAVLPGVVTGQAVVMVSESGENAIVVVPGANGEVGVAAVQDGLTGLTGHDVVVLQNELPPEASRAAAASARSAGATVVWNAAPAPRRREDLPGHVDVLVVNEHELAVVAGLLLEAPGDDDLLDAAATVGERLGCVVVVTRGGAGSSVVDGACRSSVPAERVEVVDTTAAGDTFIGYLVAGPVEEGVTAVDLARAGAAAALTVTRPGAAPSIPHRDELAALDAAG